MYLSMILCSKIAENWSGWHNDVGFCAATDYYLGIIQSKEDLYILWVRQNWFQLPMQVMVPTVYRCLRDWKRCVSQYIYRRYQCKGLHHLVYEVVDNSIDEGMEPVIAKINVTINEPNNSITVQDDGRGILRACTARKRSAWSGNDHYCMPVVNLIRDLTRFPVVCTGWV